MSINHRHSAQTVFIILASTVLASCSSLRSLSEGVSSSAANPVNWITPYKVDIIQGNFISSEQVAQLRPGMTREEVKAVCGTPLMASVFHANRWDYVFTLKRQGVASQSFKYTLYFKGNQLERFEGDAMPSEQEFLAMLESKNKPGTVPSLQATPEQLKTAEKPDSARAAADSAVASASALADTQATAYPPLEVPKQ